MTVPASRAQLFTGIALLLAVLLAACAPTPEKPPLDEDELALMEDSARVMAETGDHEAAAGIYEDIASRLDDVERPSWLLRAANAWVDADNTERARTLVDGLRPDELELDERYRTAMVMSRIDLAENRPREAHARLDVREDAVPSEVLAELLKIRGEALFRMEDVIAGIRDMARRAEVLDGTERRRALEDVWDSLLGMPNVPAPEAARDEPEVSGWLSLAHAGRDSWQRPDRFEQAIEDWAATHPGHPATDITEHLLDQHWERFTYPDQVALLLPLSGRFAELGEAVRDGFLAAHFAQPAERRPKVRVHDTGEDPEQTLAAYRQAEQEGAGMVVGPLTREGLAELARLDERPIPVLALNYLRDEERQPSGIVQFGLQPEEEARQVARRMVREGLDKSIALVPESGWGMRMLDAYRDELEALGGQLLDYQSYLPNQRDHSGQLTRVLGLDRSQDRHSRLERTLESDLNFEPRRRQDVTGIFLASPQEDQASLIRPQLRFHHAMDLPVFATSHVYRPGHTSDTDLDGIRFADMPWSLDREGEARDARERVAELWPELFQQHGRMFALGFDAYRLVPVMLNFEYPLEPPLAAMTGVLSLEDGRIRRDLGWAIFSRGEPVPMDPLDEIALPTRILLDGP